MKGAKRIEATTAPIAAEWRFYYADLWEFNPSGTQTLMC